MPELPEVECVCRTLRKKLIGQKILDIDIRYPKMIEENPIIFKKNLLNNTFIDIKRRGKFIIFCLTNDIYLISHLRMEGKFFLEEKNSMDNKHIHVIFKLTDYDLYYQDVRKFGIMVTKNSASLFSTKPLNSLALDPLENVDIDNIYHKLQNKKICIKEALLDQSIMSGLGNIYVDEVLFIARISPLRKSNNISKDEVISIVNISKDIFLKSIENGGTTIKSFTSSRNHAGSFQNFLLVHTKKVCPICKSDLKIEKIGGRGTYYCTKCQK